MNAAPASIGDGTADCFILIPAEGWDADVYTEIYVKLEDSAFIFSDEYDDIIAARADRWRRPSKTALSAVTRKSSTRRRPRWTKPDRKSRTAKPPCTKARSSWPSPRPSWKAGRQQLAESQQQMDQLQKAYDESVAEYQKQEDNLYDYYDYLEGLYSEGALSEEQYHEIKNELDEQLAARLERSAAAQEPA